MNARIAAAVLVAVLCVLGYFSPYLIAPRPPEPRCDWFDKSTALVSKSRIFRVPDAGQAQAMAALGNKVIARADPAMMKALFPGQSFDTEEMLRTQAAESDARARRMEEMRYSSDEVRSCALIQAKGFREFSQYTRKLSRDLIPHLINAETVADVKDGWEVSWTGKVLRVNNGAIGLPRAKKVAILVFLEQETDAAISSVSFAK